MKRLFLIATMCINTINTPTFPTKEAEIAADVSYKTIQDTVSITQKTVINNLIPTLRTKASSAIYRTTNPSISNEYIENLKIENKPDVLAAMQTYCMSNAKAIQNSKPKSKNALYVDTAIQGMSALTFVAAPILSFFVLNPCLQTVACKSALSKEYSSLCSTVPLMSFLLCSIGTLVGINYASDSLKSAYSFFYTARYGYSAYCDDFNIRKTTYKNQWENAAALFSNQLQQQRLKSASDKY